jgi:hypothetical protein
MTPNSGTGTSATRRLGVLVIVLVIALVAALVIGIALAVWLASVVKWLRVRLRLCLLCECIITIQIQESMLRNLGTCSVKNCSVCTRAVQSKCIQRVMFVCVHVCV